MNSQDQVLNFQSLKKSYGHVTALDSLTLTLPKGKVIGLLGPNGSGKTTLIKLIAGLITPTAGSLTVAGRPVGEESRALVSYLPERNSLPLRMTPNEVFAYFADFFPDFDRAKAEQMIDRLGVDRDRPVSTLSKGMKEKVQLVVVMSRKVPLYLLDEPIGGVDPATREFILETIREGREPGSTVLLSTHLIADCEPILDEFLFVAKGQIFRYGSAEETRQTEGKTLDALFREVFRC